MENGKNTTSTTSAITSAKVQHVTKASSDQLLWKFAEVGSESDHKLLAKRRKRVEMIKSGGHGRGHGRDDGKSLNGSSTAIVERKALLSPGPGNSRSSAALIRRLGIGKARVRARDFKNKSIMGTIEKTWRKTVEGASRVFMEKHYNRHKRLINDMY